MNPVGWFEIPVSDMERAQAFYEGVLQVELSLQPEQNGILMSWFPMEEKAIGAMGSLVKGEGHVPSSDGVLIYFTAPDLEAHEARVREHGGEVLQPRVSIGEYGFMSVIRDTEGNKVALHSREG